MVKAHFDPIQKFQLLNLLKKICLKILYITATPTPTPTVTIMVTATATPTLFAQNQKNYFTNYYTIFFIKIIIWKVRIGPIGPKYEKKIVWIFCETIFFIIVTNFYTDTRQIFFSPHFGSFGPNFLNIELFEKKTCINFIYK